MARLKGHSATLALACAIALVTSLALIGCSANAAETPTTSHASSAATGSGQKGGQETTSGAAFAPPSTVTTDTFNDATAVTGPGCAIDVSHAAQGYAGARATSSSRLKLQVSCGDASYNYDMPSDGTPIFVPMNMGSGTYAIRIMQNTSGSSYVELLSTSVPVALDSDFAPFLLPNVFCDYDESSACVKKARELTAGCATQADAVRAICEYIATNVSYDTAKAERLSSATGYVPDPDATLASMTGICFDYASLGAAMLRSVGIPTRIVTGYVSPEGFYHAWIMVNIDGTWHSVEFSVDPGTWSRLDLTFAATGDGNSFVGDGVDYQDRYTY